MGLGWIGGAFYIEIRTQPQFIKPSEAVQVTVCPSLALVSRAQRSTSTPSADVLANRQVRPRAGENLRSEKYDFITGPNIFLLCLILSLETAHSESYS